VEEHRCVEIGYGLDSTVTRSKVDVTKEKESEGLKRSSFRNPSFGKHTHASVSQSMYILRLHYW
jgi:hypothetical protein